MLPNLLSFLFLFRCFTNSLSLFILGFGLLLKLCSI
nr:MAG TPA: hypothetical protein [Caudoviricetes sp.]